MEEVSVPLYIIKEAKDALRMASNILESNKRLTCADRCIEYSGRLLEWVLNGKQGDPPKYIPKK